MKKRAEMHLSGKSKGNKPAPAINHDLLMIEPKTIAQRLQINLRAVYRLIRSGRLPAYKIGRAIRVYESDFDKLLEGVRMLK